MYIKYVNNMMNKWLCICILVYEMMLVYYHECLHHKLYHQAIYISLSLHMSDR